MAVEALVVWWRAPLLLMRTASVNMIAKSLI